MRLPRASSVTVPPAEPDSVFVAMLPPVWVMAPVAFSARPVGAEMVPASVSAPTTDRVAELAENGPATVSAVPSASENAPTPVKAPSVPMALPVWPSATDPAVPDSDAAETVPAVCVTAPVTDSARAPWVATAAEKARLPVTPRVMLVAESGPVTARFVPSVSAKAPVLVKPASAPTWFPAWPSATEAAWPNRLPASSVPPGCVTAPVVERLTAVVPCTVPARTKGPATTRLTPGAVTGPATVRPVLSVREKVLAAVTLPSVATVLPAASSDTELPEAASVPAETVPPGCVTAPVTVRVSVPGVVTVPARFTLPVPTASNWTVAPRTVLATERSPPRVDSRSAPEALTKDPAGTESGPVSCTTRPPFVATSPDVPPVPSGAPTWLIVLPGPSSATLAALPTTLPTRSDSVPPPVGPPGLMPWVMAPVVSSCNVGAVAERSMASPGLPILMGPVVVASPRARRAAVMRDSRACGMERELASAAVAPITSVRRPGVNGANDTTPAALTAVEEGALADSATPSVTNRSEPWGADTIPVFRPNVSVGEAVTSVRSPADWVNVPTPETWFVRLSSTVAALDEPLSDVVTTDVPGAWVMPGAFSVTGPAVAATVPWAMNSGRASVSVTSDVAVTPVSCVTWLGCVRRTKLAVAARAVVVRMPASCAMPPGTVAPPPSPLRAMVGAVRLAARAMEALSARPAMGEEPESWMGPPLATTSAVTASPEPVYSATPPGAVKPSRVEMRLLAPARVTVPAAPDTVATASGADWVTAPVAWTTRRWMPGTPRSMMRSPAWPTVTAPACGTLGVPAAAPTWSVAARTWPNSVVVSERPVTGLAPLVSSTLPPAV